MLNNGYVLRHYADKYGSGDYEEYEIRFYDEAGNKRNVLVPISFTRLPNINIPTKGTALGTKRATIVQIESSIINYWKHINQK